MGLDLAEADRALSEPEEPGEEDLRTDRAALVRGPERAGVRVERRDLVLERGRLATDGGGAPVRPARGLEAGVDGVALEARPSGLVLGGYCGRDVDALPGEPGGRLLAQGQDGELGLGSGDADPVGLTRHEAGAGDGGPHEDGDEEDGPGHPSAVHPAGPKTVSFARGPGTPRLAESDLFA